MLDLLFLVGIVLVGFLPAATMFFRRKRLSVVSCGAWLGLAAILLLRPAANNPHPFGFVLFLLFAIGWFLAFAVIIFVLPSQHWRQSK
jgi:hypothetical protein